MKKTRSLIIMVAVLVAMVGGFALFKLLGGPGSEEDPASTSSALQNNEPLVSLKAEELKSIVIKNEQGEMLLQPLLKVSEPETDPTSLPVTGAADPTAEEEYVWTLLEPQTEGLDASAVTDLGDQLLSLSIVDELGVKTADELKDFGLDKPQAEAVYTLKDGTVKTVVLGNRVTADTGEKYYAMDKDKNRVVLVTSAADRLQTSYFDLLNRDVISLEAEQVKAFSLERKQDSFILKTESKEVNVKDQNGEMKVVSQWDMTEPVPWTAAASTVGNFLGEIVQLKAEDFELYTPEKAKEYGLDDPEYRIALQSDQVNETLLIGRSISANEAYAMIEGSKYIFSFNRGLLTQVGLPALDFYQSFAALINITTVDRLTFIARDEKINAVSEIFNPTAEEIKKAEDKGEERPVPAYSLNGRNADYENKNRDNVFTKYYQAVIGIKIAGFDKTAEVPDKKPSYEVHYRSRNNDPDTDLLFIERDAKTLYLVKNDEYTGFYVNKTDFTSHDSADSPGVIYALELLEKEIKAQGGSEQTAAVTSSEGSETSSSSAGGDSD